MRRRAKRIDASKRIEVGDCVFITDKLRTETRRFGVDRYPIAELLERKKNNSCRLKLVRSWESLGESGTTLSRCYNVSKLAKVSADVRQKLIRETNSVENSSIPDGHEQIRVEEVVVTTDLPNVVPDENLQALMNLTRDTPESINHTQNQPTEYISELSRQKTPSKLRITYSPSSNKRIRDEPTIGNQKAKRRRVQEPAERRKGETLSRYYRRIGTNE